MRERENNGLYKCDTNLRTASGFNTLECNMYMNLLHSFSMKKKKKKRRENSSMC